MTDIALAQRIENFLQGNWTGSRRIQGLQGGARAYMLALAARRANRPFLIVCPSAREAEYLYEDLIFFLGEAHSGAPLQKRVHLFPSWEVLPFENLSPHPENIAGRLEGLYKLVEEPAPVLIATPAALMQKVIPKESLKRSYLYLVAGQELSREALLEHLVAWGFQNVPLAEEPGDFSIRGGIVDCFSPGYALPLRLEFDGDRLDSIREFNPSTQRSAQQREEMLLLPMKEFSLKQHDSDAVVRRLDQRAVELEVDRRAKNTLIESVRAGIPFPGMEFLVPYFSEPLVPVTAYLPAQTLIWFDGADRIEAEAERFGQTTWERSRQAEKEHRLVATVESYLTTDIRQETVHTGKDPTLLPLVEHFKAWEKQRVIFVTPTKADGTRLRELLVNYNYQLPLVETSLPVLMERTDFAQAIICGQLNHGFRMPEAGLVVVTFDEIFGTRKRQPAGTTKRHPSHFLTSLSELKQDDFVVHLDHGIGVYRGLKFLQVAGVEGEFLHLEYDG